MLKLKLFIAYFFISVCTGYSQFDSYISIDFQKSNLLIIGEFHNIAENSDIQLNIIKDIAVKSDKNIEILIEFSPSFEYYLEKLFNNNDSISLLNYMLNKRKEKHDTLGMALTNQYELLMNLYYYSKTLSEKSFKIKCIDKEYLPRALLFTLKDIFGKYEIKDSALINQICALDSIQLKEVIDYTDFKLFDATFRAYYFRNIELFKSTLNPNDFYYVSRMLEYSSEIDRYSPEREKLMARNVIRNYFDSLFYILITGINHSNKNYYKKLDIRNNNISTGYLLNNENKSPFRNKVISVAITRRYFNTGTRIFNYEYAYPCILNSEVDYLNSLVKGNIISCINLKSTRLKYAKRFFDYFIIIENSNSIYDF